MKFSFIFGGVKMRKETYNTKQKQLIFEILEKNNETQLSCDEISDLLKNQGTPVGKTTVYRFVEKLTSEGVLRKFENSKFASYQLIDKNLCCDEHMHLKCTSCGKFIHLGCDFMSEVGKHVAEHHNFTVDNSKTVLLGICDQCKGLVR